jgi:hypothetical protein
VCSWLIDFIKNGLRELKGLRVGVDVGVGVIVAEMEVALLRKTHTHAFL